jgi:peptide/nickel transport system permease protein
MMTAAAVAAPWLAPHSPVEGSLPNQLLPPVWHDGGSKDFLLGTDNLGRDILTRLIFGARVSLAVAIIAIAVSAVFGVAIGMIAGYFGKWLDAVLMRLTDLALSLPTILLALVLATIFEPSFMNVNLVIVLVLWSRFARQVRGEVLTVKQRDFVALARVAGCSTMRILVRHILPNVTNTIIVITTFQVAWVILLESTLSFLGVGIPPPMPAWGLMVAEGRNMLASAYWIALFPGLAIALTVLSINLLGDWLRDVLDPRLRQI